MKLIEEGSVDEADDFDLNEDLDERELRGFGVDGFITSVLRFDLHMGVENSGESIIELLGD